MRPPQKGYFKRAGDVPNSSLPVLVFRSVVAPQVGGKAHMFREIFKKNKWARIWTDTIYDFTHFHSNAHEVLAIAEGRVTLKLGGKRDRLAATTTILASK